MPEDSKSDADGPHEDLLRKPQDRATPPTPAPDTRAYLGRPREKEDRGESPSAPELIVRVRRGRRRPRAALRRCECVDGEKLAKDATPEADQSQADPRLHPVVREWIVQVDVAVEARRRVIVSLAGQEDVRSLVQQRQRTITPQAERGFAARVRDFEVLRASVEETLEATYERLSANVEASGGEVVHRFWLSKAAVIEIDAAGIPNLIEDSPEITFVEPAALPEVELPKPKTLSREAIDGQRLIARARALHLTTEYETGSDWSVAMLDTGIDEMHPSLQGGHWEAAISRHCTANASYPDCTVPCKGDCDDLNHGTGVAAILAASPTAEIGRGVTTSPVQSYRVWGSYNVVVEAAILALEEAVLQGAAVIAIVFDKYAEALALSEPEATERSNLNTTVDNCFWAGRVIVAATGNSGPGAGSVSAGASAHCALAIGAQDIVDGLDPDNSGGPTSDGRTKPDCLAYSGLTTAQSGGAGVNLLTNTSSATPVAAGAAVLLYQYMWEIMWEDWQTTGKAWPPWPGYVYSALIAFGDNPLASDQKRGAGLFALPERKQFEQGHVSWDVEYIGEAAPQPVEIDIIVSGDHARFDVALWWPEVSDYDDPAATFHSEIHLEVVDPDGKVSASVVPTGVFQKVAVTAPIKKGIWTIRIDPIHIWGPVYSTMGSQVEYFQPVFWTTVLS